MKRSNILCVLVLAVCGPAYAADSAMPALRKNGSAVQLFAGGQPFLILGGELHNSSASSLEYMEPIWPRLKAMSLNTVLATVSWELLEPREGTFDFRLVDGLIQGARANRMRLVLLWFGSWKNGVSSYVPLWVKRDPARFPRVRNRRGSNLDILSPLSENSRIADARAFAALMKHLREIDSAQATVLMIQAENEVGVRPESRDRSPAAQDAWNAAVPPELLRYLGAQKGHLIPELDSVWAAQGYRTEGTWQEVFGSDAHADEVFMAWHFARYIGSVVEAGKHEYPLPVYVNAWLVQNDKQVPGDYPSGGPVSRMMDVWRAAAPAVDLFAPDIYLPDFPAVCASYTRSGNPLFIPEASRGPESAANVFYAIGRHNAIGFSPFAIDELPKDHPIASAYALLDSLAPMILTAQAAGAIAGFAQGNEEINAADLGNYHFEVRYPSRKGVKGAGLILSTGPDEFYVAGLGVSVRYSSRDNALTARIGEVDEGSFVDGKWSPGRRLNGDETAGGGEIRLPDDVYSIQRVRLYRHAR
jgi:hypothetical protein